MGTKYTTQLISGYNANPPPDDGTTGDDNKVTWQKHLDKLSGPLKDLAENINSNLVTELDESLVVVNSGPYSQVASHYKKTIACDATSAAFTVDLLAAATAGNGFVVHIIKTDSSANRITVNPSGTETVNGQLTVKLNHQYDSVTLRCDGSNWNIESDKRAIGFFAHRNGTDQTGIATGWTKVSLTNDSTDPGFDSNSDFDNATGTWTCREAGTYIFTGTILMLGVTDTDYARCRIYKNGSVICNGSSAAQSGSQQASSVAVVITECAVSDTIELHAFHDSASSLDIDGDSFKTNLTGALLR